MTKEWVVLHLTDFHIDNPSGDDEPLRDGFYRQYIKCFSQALNDYPDTHNKSIDAIVITGDFVNGGINKDNFSHAEKVIQHLCEKFNVQQERVFVCNGNHDIDRPLEFQSDFVGARRLYNDFAGKFGNGKRADESKRYSLVKTGFGVHVLLIDSTLYAYGESRPGDISVNEMDDIYNAIDEQEIGQEELLIVASHHPVYAFRSPFGPNPDPDDEDKWNKKHLWESAPRLSLKLNRNFKNPILWLSGDIHVADQQRDGIIHAVVTGRFGTSTKSIQTLARRQGRLVVISSRGKFKSWLCQYEPRGHVDDQENERWIVFPAHYPNDSDHENSGGSDETHQTEEQAKEREDDKSTGKLQEEIPPHQPRILSELLQAKIIETITKNRLYHLGRYATSENEASLAWVPMGGLMNSGELFPFIVTAMSQHINKLLADSNECNSIIVGLDSWGAILASQLSVITGIENICIAARAGGRTHTPLETIGIAMQDNLRKFEHVILVSDVIGTGSTLKYVHEKSCEKMSAEQKQNIKWTVLSVICDKQRDRRSTLGFAYSNMTACSDLEMPILSKGNLPNEDILPTDISFIGQFPLSSAA